MNMRKIAFICNEPGIGGGFNVIFHHAMGLVRQGATVAIVCAVKVTKAHLEWHAIRELNDNPNLLWLDFDTVMHHRFDVAIATWWRTFFDLWKVEADRYVYFVQSIESRFYDVNDRLLRAAVDATYDASLGYITEATWIGDYLTRMHGHDVAIAPNGVDKEIYCPSGPAYFERDRNKLRVLVEGPVDAEFKNVPASIRLAREGGADEIWLLTSSPIETSARLAPLRAVLTASVPVATRI